jgi:hypothetical protein
MVPKGGHQLSGQAYGGFLVTQYLSIVLVDPDKGLLEFKYVTLATLVQQCVSSAEPWWWVTKGGHQLSSQAHGGFLVTQYQSINLVDPNKGFQSANLHMPPYQRRSGDQTTLVYHNGGMSMVVLLNKFVLRGDANSLVLGLVANTSLTCKGVGWRVSSWCWRVGGVGGEGG